MRGYSRHFWVGIPAIGVLLAACAAGQIRDQIYTNEAKGFAVQLPSEAWDAEIGKESDLLLRHRSRQAGMLVNATCGKIPPDRPLETSARHLFFGIRGKEILRQERRTDNQGEALEMVLKGVLGGQKLLLHGYTLKGPDCVYDLALFATPEEYSESNGEFEALVQRFQLLSGEQR